MTIDRTSRLPFYFQLKQLLAAEIEAGRFRPGDRIPSESDLCQAYGVSRATVRQALAELESDGVLRRKKGRGTFVAVRPQSSWFVQSSSGFFDEAARSGKTVRTSVLRAEIESLPGWAAEALDVPPNTEGFTLERLRSVDGELTMYVVSHLRADLASLVEGADLETGSLYRRLREHGVTPAGGRRVVEAVAAGEHFAELLQVDPNAPLLLVEAVTWDQDLLPFEAFRAWHRSDRTKITVHAVAEDVVVSAGLDEVIRPVRE